MGLLVDLLIGEDIYVGLKATVIFSFFIYLLINTKVNLFNESCENEEKYYSLLSIHNVNQIYVIVPVRLIWEISFSFFFFLLHF